MMQSPPIELVLDVAHLGARNLIRNAGPADGDTISECIRAASDRLPYSDVAFGVILAAAAAGFWHHIRRPKT